MARRTTRRSTTDNADTQVDETPETEGQSEETTVTATAPEVEQTEAPAEANDNETPEAQDSEAGSTEPQENAEATAEAAAEAADPVDALMELSEKLLDDRDRSTATLPEATVAKFGAEYRKLDSGQKRQARTKITARVQELLDDDSDTMMDSVLKAKAYNELMNETKRAAAPASRAAAAAKVDPNEAYVHAYLTIALATLAVPEPEGLDKEKAMESIGAIIGAYNTPDSQEAEAFNKYVKWARNTDTENRGDEPEVPEYVKAALKVADGKAAGRGRRGASSSGPRAPRQAGGPQGNIGKHVEQALADREVGEFVSIAELAKFVSTEYGEDKRPSAGAISARLFPKSTIEGVEGVLATDSPEGKKGARRTA